MSKITSLNSTKSKETIYVDIDDEITNIIEKVRGSKANIVALVLPKRASTLQSIVNMKLLKRSADQASKNLVLVTTEKNLLPLAGAVGLHVADTATSRPAIPTAPTENDEIEDIDEPSSVAAEDFDPKRAAGVAVGTLAGMPNDEEDDEIVVPADSSDEDSDSAGAVGGAAATKAKRDKKLAVPSFDSFRKRLALGVVAAVALIGFLVWALVFAPSSTIKLTTETSTVSTDIAITLSTEAKELDPAENIVPAVAQAQKKAYTQQVSATGQQNNGEKATGSVTFTASDCTLPANTPDSISAGSSVTSNGKTYITQERAIFTQVGTTDCVNYRTNAVAITALRGGAEYNLSSGSSFTGAGNGTGSATGGTDDIVKVVTQSDIDGAKAKIAAQDTSAIKQSLEEALIAKNLRPMSTTFLASEPQVTSSAKPGDKADAVTVTANVNYNMLGVSESDLKTIIETNVKDEIDSDKEKILDNGLAKAIFSQESPASTTSAVIQMKATSVAGPEIDVDEIKNIAKGKKSGQIEQELKAIPGVTEVKVEYSPFWVTSVPTKESKISVSINETK